MAATQPNGASAATAQAAAPLPLLKDFCVAVFSAQTYVKDYLEGPLRATVEPKNLRFIEARLDSVTAELAHGCQCVCLFVNDNCDAKAVDVLADKGVRFIAMRCAGFDKVDLEACARRGIRVVRVPAYSPRSVAEHAFALSFALARELHNQIPRVKAGNYTLNGIVGIELSFKTYGVVGTGNIGIEMIKLLRCLGGRILAFDPYPSEEAKSLGAEYVTLEQLLAESDLVSLHCPLMASTFNLLNAERLQLMKPSALLINVSRGGLINTNALLDALERNQLRGAAMDVYENEGNLFDEDFTQYASKDRMTKWDRQWTMLKSLPNVIVTPHSAFLTQEALRNIADTTAENVRDCASGGTLRNEVLPRK
ncbi:D-lactate dehydrogenase [Micractinium conductrix]|uniref:D-lactate dehydrogenase n=1 Tax=Micractinium conductrix TaxID=554055 RepID=A0A2P6VCD3_9CHLO|nr:D-lactate dehydrogenase [Micractinium conductrix]|eukprot:PSC71755.1 D-lactate dehydrogenase [Micractinium conductrix]